MVGLDIVQLHTTQHQAVAPVAHGQIQRIALRPMRSVGVHPGFSHPVRIGVWRVDQHFGHAKIASKLADAIGVGGGKRAEQQTGREQNR